MALLPGLRGDRVRASELTDSFGLHGASAIAQRIAIEVIPHNA
ncbi:MAG: hypothetical protein AAFX95_00440 [Cyanobacteria bacterium J06639_16]